ncbi:MAG: HAD hydrolase-like protein, partial [Clostridia bacterium]|nr:HAD hydrolase-like protein [Clostridia bacterium]
DAYRAIFDFPVREYYRRAGVGDNIFDEVANAWALGYVENFEGCPLRADALPTVRRFHGAGLNQVIISASKQTHLKEQVSHFPQLAAYLDRLMGLEHIYATSKVHLAQDYLKEMALAPHEVILLGDTRHDHEVAQAIGCDCLLIMGGHQPRNVLAATGRPVMASLAQAADWILNAQGAQA